MNAPLLSSSWYRVASLKPVLRPHAKLHRHRYRGEVWYLLQDPASNRVHRFSPAARSFIASMNGRRTVEQLWEMTNKRLKEDAPSQDDIINLLGQLHSSDLLQSDISPDASEAFERGQREAKAQSRRSYMNPLAVRIPLWDPDAFLNRINTFSKMIWSWWGALLWLIIVIPALVMIPPHWQELTNNFSDRMLALDNIFIMWLVFPVIKALHELGHGSATKAGGGEVHDMGVMLLVLMPVPYVEASAANAFKSKYSRAVVGAAGMIVELFIAAIAFYLWLILEPGLLRAVMFNVMMIAGVTTLLFNGNPLLRYDAYYILTDLIEIPNLAGRATRYWEYLFRRYVSGVRDAEAPTDKKGEKAWFLFYGPASSLYRVFVTIAIALFVATQFLVVGILLAMWAIVTMIGLPVFKGLKYLFSSPALTFKRARAVSVSTAFLAGLLIFLCLIPMPFRSNAEGVIWFADEAIVRASADGFVYELGVDPGQRVEKGQVLLKLHDAELEAQVQLSAARVRELEALYSAEFVRDQSRASVVREQLAAERAALERARERLEGLSVKAGADGVFVLPEAANIRGRFFAKGALLGYVVEKGQPLARVVVDQNLVDMIRIATDEVAVRHVHRRDFVSTGKIIRFSPAARDYLPSKVLSTEGGGLISVDPRDQSGAKTMQRMFEFDIELDKQTEQVFWGERVYVRFNHEKEPLAMQWYRSIRLLFLSQFSV